jgi:hypothetical protein
MQEINRAAALLGRKTQECNTRDKQELGTACPLDQTIRLLCSQTALLPRWSSDVVRAGLARPDAGNRKRLIGRKFFVIARSRSFPASRSITAALTCPPALATADHRPSRKSCGESRFATDAILVLGLLPMWQALKHARRTCFGTLMVKGAPIANSRDIRVIGLNVQFAGQATSFGPLLVTDIIALCAIAAAVAGPRHRLLCTAVSRGCTPRTCPRCR